jgi:hypothetical protein
MELMDSSAGAAETRLLTFQTWVTEARWYDYAVGHPDMVPLLLIDRSPCQDPFFDPLAAPLQRRPVISGLCRGRAMRNLNPGDRFLYITRIAPPVANQIGVHAHQGHSYFSVAALRVVTVWQSHQEAAADFEPRRYVAKPTLTPYPPNLAFEPHPVAAADRECSVIHDENDKWHLADDSTDRMWTRQYLGYRTRQIRSQLRAAECAIEKEDGLDCLQLRPDSAPVITPDWWGGAQMNVTGKRIPEATAAPIRRAIALGHAST